MKILVHELSTGWCCKIKIDSRPNEGDGIYLNDFDNLDIKFDSRSKTKKKVSEWISLAKEDLERTTRFVVTDVVFGKLEVFGFKKECGLSKESYSKQHK